MSIEIGPPVQPETVLVRRRDEQTPAGWTRMQVEIFSEGYRVLAEGPAVQNPICAGDPAAFIFIENTHSSPDRNGEAGNPSLPFSS